MLGMLILGAIAAAGVTALGTAPVAYLYLDSLKDRDSSVGPPPDLSLTGSSPGTSSVGTWDDQDEDDYQGDDDVVLRFDKRTGTLERW